MKYIALIALLPSFFFLGCKEKEEDLISISELANALNLSVIALEVPEESVKTKEPFYFKQEDSSGRIEWFGGFQHPGEDQHIKIITNRKSKEITVQSGNSQYGYSFTYSEMKYSTGWPQGRVKHNNYIMCFGDSHEAVDVAHYPSGIKYNDPDRQAKAENSNWVRYTLVRGSEVPNDAPAHIRRNIELMVQNQ